MRPIATLALPFLLIACGGDKDGTVVPKTTPTGDTGPTDTVTDTGTPPALPCDPLPAQTGITVTPSDNLEAVLADAVAGDVFLVEPGTYTIGDPIVLSTPVTVRSSTDVATDVVIDMDYASGDLIQVAASDVTLAHLTLTRSGDALVRTTPDGASITGLRLHDVRLIDPAGVAVVIAPSADETAFADDGAITCSHLELTNDGRDEVVGLCGTGGIDASFVRGWEVRDNTIDGFWCERELPAAPGIRFTRGSRDVQIFRNVLLDSPRGIVAGQTPDQLGRRYDDDPCGDVFAQGIDISVTNNIVSAWRDALVFDSDFGIEYGIRAESSCNVRLIHNSVAHREMPSGLASIEHRYPITSGMVGNNYVSHSVTRSDDSTADVDTNIELAPPTSWYFPTQDDFHLAPAATDAIDQGSTAFLTEVPEDLDREARDGAPDVGADERL